MIMIQVCKLSWKLLGPVGRIWLMIMLPGGKCGGVQFFP